MSQEHCVVLGEEFGLENVGKVALIQRALYGGKSAGRDFRNHLREFMANLKFTPCLADPDVWMRPAQKADGTEYWEYVLLYVDKDLVISENGKEILVKEIGKYFTMKPGSIGYPSLYLRGHMRQVILVNDMKAWGFISSEYFQAAVKNFEEYLTTTEHKLPSKALTPIQTSYGPEIDTSK